MPIAKLYTLLLSFCMLITAACNNPEKADTTVTTNSTKIDSPVADIPPAPITTTVAPAANDSLNFLREMNGKYPQEVKLLENKMITGRLKKLLGGRYAFLQQTWSVESPITVSNNVFVAGGCMQHNCGATNFTIIINLEKNVLYAGVREEEKVKTYAEDGSSNAELDKWAKGN